MATADAPQADKQPDPQDRPEDDRPLDPTEEFPRPPDEDFWEKYSGRLEMPLSGTASVLFHVLVVVMFLFGLPFLMGLGKDRSAVPIRLMEVGGMDDDGEGKAGSGGLEMADQGANNPFDVAVTPSITDPNLPQPKEDTQKVPLEDPNGTRTADEQIKAALASKQKDPTKKPGSKVGSGSGDGSGYSGQSGPGGGGYGNDGTWKRGMRWTIRFDYEDAREYCKQLASAGAAVLVQDAPRSKTGTLYADMSNPKVGRPGSENEPPLAGRLAFYDQNTRKIRTFLEYIGANADAQSYGVYFSKEFEDELGRKEQAYRNRRPEDIDRTVFRFVNRGGKYEAVVVEQTPKR
ncbi:MAG: hypothetical protein K2X82_08665 [Gemmataceae bacterium]|nr:hypothetical protein [Gemmataceae bacterium]